VGRPRLHDQATRVALLDAAERLIEAHGPDGASVRGVAEAVGTTTRAVYSVFGSKDGMLEALAARLFDFLVAAIDDCPLSDDPLSDLVEASLQAFRRTACEHPALYGLVFLRVVPDLRLGDQFNSTAARAFTRLEAMMHRLSDQGMLGTTKPADAAVALHALTEGLASMELRGAVAIGADPERLWRSGITALVAGFAAVVHDPTAG
jgi:AcrR family transcriptional regulator